MDHLGRIIECKTDLVLDRRFFGQLCMKMDVVESQNVPTCATDGKRFFYNPLFVALLGKPEMTGVVCHEVLHCALGHIWRRGTRDAVKWNVACDAIINPMVIEAKMSLPKDAIFPEVLNEKYGTNIDAGMSAEQVYSLLPDDVINDFSFGCGQILDPAEDAGTSHDEKGWAKATIQAAHAHKQAGGNLPGALEDVIDGLENPKVDWRAALHNLIQRLTIARDDYTWRFPNPRYRAFGYLPSMFSESVPPIRMYCDTSGSCWDKETLTEFGNEISGVLDQCRPEYLSLNYFDTSVHEGEVFYPGDEVVLHPKGGGGTLFQPIFDHVKEIGDNPAAVIVLSDGYIFDEWPDEPDYPVIFVMNSEVEAPWGVSLDIRP